MSHLPTPSTTTTFTAPRTHIHLQLSTPVAFHVDSPVPWTPATPHRNLHLASPRQPSHLGNPINFRASSSTPRATVGRAKAHHLTSPPRPSRVFNTLHPRSSPAPQCKQNTLPCPRPHLTVQTDDVVRHAPIPLQIHPRPSPCLDFSCPIAHIHHGKGLYRHENMEKTRNDELFGNSNPPPEIWNAWMRFMLKEDEALSEDEDEEAVLGFLALHGGEGVRETLYAGGEDMNIE